MWRAVHFQDGGHGLILQNLVISLAIVIFFIFTVLSFLQVTDLTLARENQSSFEEYLNSNSNANPGIDLTVTVLTTGFWPSYKTFDLNLPAEMVSKMFC